MPRRLGCANTGREAGTALVEAIAAIAMLAILGVSCFIVLVSAFRAYDSAEKNSTESRRALGLSTMLCKAASRVSVPYWAKRDFIETGKDGFSVPYVDGDKESRLSFVLSKEGFIMEIAGAKTEVSGLAGCAIKAFTGKDGRICGIELLWADTGKARLLRASFSGGSL